MVFHVFVLFLSILVTSSISAKTPCETIEKGSALSIASVQACVQSLDFSDTVRQKTISTLKQIYENYVYKDIVINSGEPFHISQNVIEELNKLYNETFQSDYHFHSRVQEVFMALYDPHTVYIPPTCYSTFTVFLPFRIEKINEEYFVKEPESTISNLYVKVYPDVYNNVKKYFGKQMVKIGNDTVDSYLNTIRDTKVFYSRDSGVRFNELLKQEFHQRSLARNIFPENELTFTVLNENEEDKEITVNWAAVSALDYRFTPMKKLCGYFDSDDSRRAMTPEEKKILEFENFSFLKNVENINVEIIAKIFADVAFKAFEEKENRRETKESSEEEDGEYINIPLNYSYSTRNEKLDYFKLLRKKDSDIAVLKVITFMPELMTTSEDSETTIIDTVNYAYYFLQLYDAFGKMKEMGTKQILVDVRGNTGGIGCLAFVLAKFLSRFTPKDPAMNSQLVSSEMNKLLHCESNYIDKINFFDQKRTPVGAGWMEGNERTINNKKTYYSTMVHFGCQLVYFISQSEYYWEEDFYTFEPEDIVILTDGTCGSTCGIFVKLMQSLNLAKIVSQGGIGHEMAIASFKGAAVKTINSTIDELYLNSVFCPSAGSYDLQPLPSSAIFTYSWLMLYPWEPKLSTYDLTKVDDTTPAGFLRKPADEHVLNWDFTDNIYDDVLFVFDKCYSWNVRVDAGCKQKLGLNDPNILAGRPCNVANGSFFGECVIKGCEMGYYLSEKETCLSMPSEYNSLGDVQLLIILIIVIGVVVLICISSTCMCCFLICCALSCGLLTKPKKTAADRDKEVPSNLKYKKIPENDVDV